MFLMYYLCVEAMNEWMNELVSDLARAKCLINLQR
jgi:hypothetical protein